MADESKTGTIHVPVMPDQVMELLCPSEGEVWIDATVGGGGHTKLLAEKVGKSGKVIGLDVDPEMLEQAKARLKNDPVEFEHASFDHLRDLLSEKDVSRVDGLLADLGVCSDQLDCAERGLSFLREGPLDMRLDPSFGEPASKLVNRMGERNLADLIYQYGEERFSRRIARRIVREREKQAINTTTELADIVRSCVPRPKTRRGTLDPATRVFQALRIAVNDEFGSLERLLKSLPSCIRPGGRVAVISFHSLEDRLVKQSFRNREYWVELTKKPVQATEKEIQANPRARSAKLRVAERAK